MEGVGAVEFDYCAVEVLACFYFFGADDAGRKGTGRDQVGRVVDWLDAEEFAGEGVV